MTAYLIVMGMLLGLAMIADLRDPIGGKSKPSTPREIAVRFAIRTGLLLWTAALLVGCGGGDPNDTPVDQPPPALDCKARPEVCR